jgi:hypothetical protein
MNTASQMHQSTLNTAGSRAMTHTAARQSIGHRDGALHFRRSWHPWVCRLPVVGGRSGLVAGVVLHAAMTIWCIVRFLGANHASNMKTLQQTVRQWRKRHE